MRERDAALLALWAAYGCTGDGDGGGDKADDTSTQATCEITVEDSVPADGDTDAYYRGTIEVELSDDDPFATIAVDGVSGESVVDGDTVTFTPDAPLDPSTSYTATVTWCGGSQDIAFTTSDLGTPLADEAALVGRVFAVPFSSGRIVEPSALAGQLRGYLTQTDLLQVDAISGDTIDMTSAFADEGTDPAVQDYCLETADFSAGDFSGSPYFEVHVDALPLVLAGTDVVLRDLSFHGTFTSDGLSIGGGDVTYYMDTRPLDPLVGGSGASEGEMCDAASRLGASCYDCPDSGEPYCLDFHLDQLEGALVDGLALVPVACADYPGCDTTPPPEDATCMQ